MKKIFLFIAILSAFISKAQFPVQQSLGGPKTEVFSKGAFGSDSGYVYRTNFLDTATVNIGFLKNIPGIVVRVGNTLYLRNQTVNAWIEIGSGGSGSTITNIGNGFSFGVDGTNNIKRFRDSIFIVCDTLLSGTIRCRVDTVTLGPWVRGFNVPQGFDDVLAIDPDLSTNRTINAGADVLTITGTAALGPLRVSNTSTGYGLFAESAIGIGILAESSGSTFPALRASSLGAAPPIETFATPTTTNTVHNIIGLWRFSTGTTTAGVGSAIPYYIQNGSGTPILANRLISKLTTVTNGAEVSEFEVAGIVGGAAETFMNIQESGVVRVNNLADTLLTKADGRALIVGSGVTAHSALTGLTSGDDHTQYALLAGRTPSQTLRGGTAARDTLRLLSTSHGSKGMIVTDKILVRTDTTAAFTSYENVGATGTVRVDVGMLGNGEANLAYNMRYDDPWGLHKSYDGSKNSLWIFMQNAGWGMQYADNWTGGGDVWDSTGNKILFIQENTGEATFNITAAERAANNLSAQLTLKRYTSLASLAGWDDLLITGHRFYGTPGDIFLNGGTGNDGNIYLGNGVGVTAGSQAANGDINIRGTTHATKTNSYVILQEDGGSVAIGTATPSGLFTLQTAVGVNPSFHMNDADVTLPDYSGISLNPVPGTNSIGVMGPVSSTTGGLFINGFSEAATNNGQPVVIGGTHGGTLPTTAAVNIAGYKWDGSTNRTSLAATEIVAQISNTSTTPLVTVLGNGFTGINTTAPDGVLELNLGTSNSFRLSYNDASGLASNRLDVTLSSVGSPTYNATGTNPEHTFSDPVNVPDDAYAAGWDGNTEVATKNALYDKIETLGGGSGETNTASNLGGGLANYSTKVGVDLQFNSFETADFDLLSNLISIDAALKSTWNGKQDAISLTTTGTSGAATLVGSTLNIPQYSGVGSQTPWTSNINGDGFTLFGNDGTGETLTLGSTSHATKGKILFGTSAYDEVNNRLGIGTASPSVPFEVTSSGSTTAINFINTASSSSTAGSFMQLISDDGAAVVSGDRLGLFTFVGSRTSGGVRNTGVLIAGYATGTYSSSNAPTKLEFEIGKTGTTTRDVVMRMQGNTLGGSISIGDITASARLHIAAGTATASSAPLKFNSGTLLTTAEAGAVEFLTDKFYGTITTGAARKEFTLNDGALTSGRVPYATTNGRLTDAAGMTFDGTGRLSLLDLSLVGLDVDNDADTLVGLVNGAAVKWVIPTTTPVGIVNEINTITYTIASASGAYIYNNSTSIGTWTLPALNEYRYEIKNISDDNLVVQRAGSDNLYDTGSVTSITLTPGQSRTIWGGTSFWYVF